MFTVSYRIQHWRCALVMLAVTLCVSSQLIAQEPATGADAETAYTRTLIRRADKIVSAIGIEDAANSGRVRDLIVQQYRQLSAIHAERDARVKVAKSQAGADAQAAEASSHAAQAAARGRLDKLHAGFLSQLAGNLTPAQVDAVKDGMTYGVVQVTYSTYLRLLPDLIDVQKQQIMTWLVEARELALDEGTADDKHKVFGKYKGKINNYLAAAGYNLKAAEQNLRNSNTPAAGAQSK